MLILIILASLFPGILAVIQYLENEKKESESQKREIDLNSKIDSLAANNLELKGEIKILSKDNVKLSHQLSETAMKLNDNVIGNGDVDVTTVSYTHLHPPTLPKRHRQPAVFHCAHGHYCGLAVVFGWFSGRVIGEAIH